MELTVIVLTGTLALLMGWSAIWYAQRTERAVMRIINGEDPFPHKIFKFLN